jgi:Ribonuclease G/E
MNRRLAYLDIGPGETRGVVTLDGRPERLLIVRDGDCAVQALGAQVVARVTAVEKAQALAFLDLGEGAPAILNLGGEVGAIVRGAAISVEIRAEARAGKGASVRYVGTAEGAPRLVSPGPGIADRLTALAKSESCITGQDARALADTAQDEAVLAAYPLKGGGTLHVELTRAFVALDVDLGAGTGAEAKLATRAANLAALNEAARVLRLKGLGGLAIIDLIGRGHDAPALLAAARAAFAADAGAAFGPVSRFGLLEFTIPRRERPVLERLLDAAGEPTVETTALRLVRALEREALADPGGRFTGLAAPEVAAAAAAPLAALTARTGPRLNLRAEPGRARGAIEITRA